jgi:O-methyltransferase domain/Dimerisation domain
MLTQRQMDSPSLSGETGQNSQSSPSQVLGLATGFWVSQALYVAAKAGIADLLADGPKPVEALAREANLHSRSLHRVLRLLASFGVFAESEPGRFHNTPASEFLETGKSGSLRSFVIMLGEPECWRSWGELLYSVSTGKSAFDHVFGMPIFHYWSANPERARIFDDAMASRSAAETAAVLAVYDFSDAKHITDIGGGSGALLAAILGAFPQLEGKLFDVPSVIERACTAAADMTVRSRMSFEAGDFFSQIPSGGDIYVLKHILHDWDDDRAKEILHRCRRAIALGSRLLLIETVIADGNDPSFAKSLDLHMLVWPGGLERTEDEYRKLLQTAGFSLRRIIRTRSAVSLIEAIPV